MNVVTGRISLVSEYEQPSRSEIRDETVKELWNLENKVFRI